MNRVSIFHMSVHFIKVELPLSLPKDKSIIANGDDNGNESGDDDMPMTLHPPTDFVTTI